MTNLEKVKILQKLEFFKDIELNDLFLMSDAIKHTEFKKSKILYATGSYVNRVFFFVNGYFEKQNDKNYYLTFGLDYVLEDKVVEANIKVNGNSKTSAFWVEKKHLFTILKEIPQFNVALIKRLNNIT